MAVIVQAPQRALRRGIALIRHLPEFSLVQRNRCQPLCFHVIFLHAFSMEVTASKPGRGHRVPGVCRTAEELSGAWQKRRATVTQAHTLLVLRLRREVVRF